MTTATQPLPRAQDRETSSGTGETGAKDPTEPMAVLALVESNPDTKYEDVARILNISKTTVYRRVQEARRQREREIQAANAERQTLAASVRAVIQVVFLVAVTLSAISLAASVWVIALKLPPDGEPSPSSFRRQFLIARRGGRVPRFQQPNCQGAITMRHVLMHGRHARRYSPSPVSYAIVLAAAVAALIAAFTIAGQPGTAQAKPQAFTRADRGAGVAYVSDYLDKSALARASAAHAAVARAALAAHAYTVRPGDSISLVAARRCGAARDWTGIYAASRLRHLTARDANALTAGQHLWLSCAYDASQLRFAVTAAPARVTVTSAVRLAGHASVVRTDPFDGQTQYGCGDGDGDGARDMPCSLLNHHHSYQSSGSSESAESSEEGTSGSLSGTYHSSYHATSSGGSYGNVSPSSYSGFQQCVISRESGGNSQVMNSSGHYGLYQFSASTWAAYGGSPGSFGHASVAQQNAVFANAMASPGGRSNWSPYDGC